MVDTIEKAILSLIEQNYPNLEFIVLDAGSTDGTLDIINRYKQYISYFRSHKDNGPAGAWNEGVDVSNGDIICFLNADDYYEKNTFLKVAEAFIENSDVEMVNVLGRVVKIMPDESVFVGHITTVETMHIECGKVDSLHPNCRFFRKNVFQKYGKFIDEVYGVMALACDFEFITRLSLYNIKNITMDFVGYNYLAHENSLTFNSNKYTKLRLYEQKVFYLERLFDQYPDLMDDKVRAKFKREYRIAYQRKVVKHIIDKNYMLAWQSMKIGIKKFGIKFFFKTARYYISYNIRFNKLFKKLKI